MRGILVSLSVFLTIGAMLLPGFPTGSANALRIGGIQLLPDSDEQPPLHDGRTPARDKPDWLPPSLGENTTVILVPGTTDHDGSDQMGRTADIGFYDAPGGRRNHPKVSVLDYPAAFGLKIFGLEIDLAGAATLNDSVAIGTARGVTDARAQWVARGRKGTIVLNGYSQSAPVAMNIAYRLHPQNLNGVAGTIPDDDLVVLVGADSRFPNTGVENVVPSVIDGMYTNGNRDPADTGGIHVISYCVRGDATCGVGNPFADPVGTAFYLIPGFFTHAFLQPYVNDYTVTKTWQSATGNTTYVVLEGDGGGNPWGMMLRALGVPAPREFDETLNAAVPVPMPGAQATRNGVAIPTPRELQEQIYTRLGATVPATDPDVVDRRARAITPKSATVTPPPMPSVQIDPESLATAVSPLVNDVMEQGVDLLRGTIRKPNGTFVQQR